MPEGPEVRREADRISAVLEGQRLQSVQFELPRLKRFETTISGQAVSAVETRGKALVLHFDGGLSMYSHNQLYGKWMVRKRGSLPRTSRSLRVALHTREYSALLYSASEIEVLDADGLAAHPFLSKLGPDVLDDRLDWRSVAARLTDERFCRRSVANLYLDQGFLAGIGNYLRSEILFAAEIGPSTRPCDLGRGQQGALSRATLDITWRSYRTGGLTNTPRRIAHMKRLGLPRRSFRFAVFDREHQPCLACGTEIRRVTIASRRLYFCPNCQT
jgi:endonuclease-8